VIRAGGAIIMILSVTGIGRVVSAKDIRFWDIILEKVTYWASLRAITPGILSCLGWIWVNDSVECSFCIRVRKLSWNVLFHCCQFLCYLYHVKFQMENTSNWKYLDFADMEVIGYKNGILCFNTSSSWPVTVQAFWNCLPC
jgi:hypothetical protein